jgi:hypothetical protein
MNTETSFIIEEYSNGSSSPKIAATIGRCIPYVLKRLRDNNIPIKNGFKNYRKFPINEDYFEKIDTPEKAYILGFFMADAFNNEKEGKIRINLSKKDISMLKFILSEIQPNRIDNIKFCNDGKYKNEDKIAYTCLYSKKLSEDLAKLGCHQNKTYTCFVPDIRDDLMVEFIHGYFDGDGGVSATKRLGKTPKSMAYFFGNKPFLIKIESALNKLGLSGFLFPRPGIHSLNYGGIRKVLKLFKILKTSRCKFFLQRKRDVFLDIINETEGKRWVTGETLDLIKELKNPAPQINPETRD